MDKYLKMFEPSMKRWLSEHYSPKEAKQRWERTVALDEKWIREEGDLGGKKNPLADNMLEAQAFFAFYDSVDRNFSTEDLQIMIDTAMGKITSLSAGCRQFALAEEIRRYLSSHPKAVVVLMGCGLDTIGHQADNGQCRYINIDYSNVIQVREKLLPSNEREKNIAYDLNDVQWVLNRYMRLFHMI